MVDTTEVFDDIVADIDEFDENGFRVIPGRRRNFKYNVKADGYMDTYIFAETPSQAIEKAAREFNVPNDVTVLCKRIAEDEFMKFRIN